MFEQIARILSFLLTLSFSTSSPHPYPLLSSFATNFCFIMKLFIIHCSHIIVCSLSTNYPALFTLFVSSNQWSAAITTNALDSRHHVCGRVLPVIVLVCHNHFVKECRVSTQLGELLQKTRLCDLSLYIYGFEKESIIFYSLQL